MTHPVVFISYSRKDEAEKDMLVSHLGVLQEAAGLIDLWSDGRIGAGEDWQAQIKQAIAQARIAILLITANFLNSRFILDTEVSALLKRCQNERLVIFPVIARACAWRAVDWLRPMVEQSDKKIQPIWREGGLYVDEELSALAEKISKTVKKSCRKPGRPNKDEGGKRRDTPQFFWSPSHFQDRESSVDRPAMFDLSQQLQSVDEVSGPVSTPSQSRRILVVDDEPTWQRRLTRNLRGIGCEVIAAGNYEQAEDILLDDLDFDLITIDLNLDKSTQYADGLELALRVRETFGNVMPIIIITGTGSLEEQRRAFRDYNVVDFIPKAKFDIEEFQHAVMKAINYSGGMAMEKNFGAV